MALASRTYSYFKPDFNSAIGYNGKDYTDLVQSQTPQSLQEVFNIFNMIDNSQADDMITYLMILQSQPLNVILLGQSMTSYNFNAPDATGLGTRDTEGGSATNIMPVMINLTGVHVLLNDGTYEIETGTTGNDQTITYDTNSHLITTKTMLEDVVKDLLLDNAWCLTKDGQILYHITKTGDSDMQRGVIMFKCLADWFNSLDNIQNQYINYLFNASRYAQTYIKTLVQQADLTAANYSQVFNDILERRVSGSGIIAIDKEFSFSTFMKKEDSGENIKVMIQMDEYGQIVKVKLGNGKDVYNLDGGLSVNIAGSVDGTSANNTMGGHNNLLDLDTYLANGTGTLPTTHMTREDVEDFLKNSFRCLHNGQWYVLMKTPTWYSSTYVYYLLPLKRYIQYGIDL